jgi:hypothetical protein
VEDVKVLEGLGAMHLRRNSSSHDIASLFFISITFLLIIKVS